MSAIIRKLKLKNDKIKPQSISDRLNLNERPVPVPSLGPRIVKDRLDAAIDIVFVHGLTGDRESTWTAKDATACWPESLLVNDLPQARIIMYGYDADVVNFWSMASQNTVGDHGQKFLTSLANLRDRTNTRTRPLAFVAHSMGGIVCQDALLKSKGSVDRHTQRIFEETKGIIFMGTPHCGSGLAEWAVIGSKFLQYFRRVNRGTLEILQQESEVMGRIRREFHTMLRGRDRSKDQEIAIICFYEELPVRLIGEVEIVPKDSATLDRYPSIGVHANHMDMTRFSDHYNSDYSNVLSELQRFIESYNQQPEEEPPSSLPTIPTPPTSLASHAAPEVTETQRQSHHRNKGPSQEVRDETAAHMAGSPNQATKPVNTFSGTFNTNGGKIIQGNNITSGGGPMTF